MVAESPQPHRAVDDLGYRPDVRRSLHPCHRDVAGGLHNLIPTTTVTHVEGSLGSRPIMDG